ASNILDAERGISAGKARVGKSAGHGGLLEGAGDAAGLEYVNLVVVEIGRINEVAAAVITDRETLVDRPGAAVIDRYHSVRAARPRRDCSVFGRKDELGT